MAKAKKKAGGASPRKADPPADQRITIINLKGSQKQADWLEDTNKQTHIPKSVIVRLALALWAEQNNRPPFPIEAEEEGEG